MSLFPPPANLVPPALDAQKLFDAKKFHETIAACEKGLAACEKELATLDKQILPRSNKSPRAAEASSADFQYYALTLLMVNALAELQEWKVAKEVLGKYRVRFPRDAWGFHAGAEVTRRDTNVKDKAAVQRAVELLEGEAARLESKV